MLRFGAKINARRIERGTKLCYNIVKYASEGKSKMSHTKRRLLFCGGLALFHFLLFCIHLSVASYAESDTLVRIGGYAIDVLLVCTLAISGAMLCRDFVSERRVKKYLLPALPFLARIFYYAPYHTVDFTLTADMLTVVAVPLATLLSLFECGLWYGAFLLICYLYPRYTKTALTDETAALCATALPLVRSLVTILGGLMIALFNGDFFGGVLLDYLLELGLALLAAALSYFSVRYAQSKL